MFNKEIIVNGERRSSPKMLADLKCFLKSPEINIESVEELLSKIYRSQAEIKNSSIEDLFILWKEFKVGHEAIFVQALAKIVQQEIARDNFSISAVVGMPNSASWMSGIFRSYFPNASFPSCTKNIPFSTHNGQIIKSLTYTERDESDGRMPVNIFLEQLPQLNSREIILVLEDVLATGESAQLFLEGLERMGVGPNKVVFAPMVSMDVQRGISCLEIEELVCRVITPIRVTSVNNKFIGTLS